MGELARLFPTEIANDPAYPGTMAARTFEGGELPALPDGAEAARSRLYRLSTSQPPPRRRGTGLD